MDIKTIPQLPYSSDLAPCNFCSFLKLRGCRNETIEKILLPVTFCLFPKLKEKFRGCCYETIGVMKEAVMKVIDTLTQEDFHGALPEVVEMVQKVHCIWRRLLRRGLEFHICTINKSAHVKKVWKLIVCSLYMICKQPHPGL